MTKKGVLAPLIIERTDGDIVIRVIDACLHGVVLEGPHFEAIARFRTRLQRALARNANSASVTLWELDVSLAEGAFLYLFAFTHPDAPMIDTFPHKVMDALFDVSAAILFAMSGERGRRSLDDESISQRLARADDPSYEIDERQVRRLRKRLRESKRLAMELAIRRRTPVPPELVPLLIPRDPDVRLALRLGPLEHPRKLPN
jgi:hypothetical protein